MSLGQPIASAGLAAGSPLPMIHQLVLCGLRGSRIVQMLLQHREMAGEVSLQEPGQIQISSLVRSPRTLRELSCGHIREMWKIGEQRRRRQLTDQATHVGRFSCGLS